jgi:hypothetical protein
MELPGNLASREEQIIIIFVRNLSRAISVYLEYVIVFFKQTLTKISVSIQASKSTDNLDNALGEKSYVSSHSVNNLFEIKTLETRVKKISFGTSTIGSTTIKQKIVGIRQEVRLRNQRMLPRNENGNLLMKYFLIIFSMACIKCLHS